MMVLDDVSPEPEPSMAAAEKSSQAAQKDSLDLIP